MKTSLPSALVYGINDNGSIEIKSNLYHEERLVEFLNLKYEKGIKKSLHQLESNLRYLSILANGAPINKNEDRKIMDFLRIHYDYLQKLSVPA